MAQITKKGEDMTQGKGSKSRVSNHKAYWSSSLWSKEEDKTTAKVATSYMLYNSLIDFGIKKDAISKAINVDAYHLIPELTWITTTFSSKFQEWQKKEGIFGDWQISYDCDDYAVACRYFSSRCLRATKKTGLIDGVPVFRCLYRINAEPNKGHAINIMYTDKGWIFYEPQTCKQVELTAQEITTIWLIY